MAAGFLLQPFLIPAALTSKGIFMNDLTIEQKKYRIGFLFALIGTALFSIKAIFIKLAFIEGVDATIILTLRMLISFPFYLLILFYALNKRGASAAIFNKPDLFFIFILGFFGYYLAAYLDFEGLFYVSAQLERLTLFTYPIMVALLSWIFFREKITLSVWRALFLSYLGISLLYFNDDASQLNQNRGLGIALVATAALSFSFYVIFSKKFIGRYGSIIFTSMAMSSSTFFILVHFSLTHQMVDLNVSSTTWFLCALLAIFSTVIPSFFLSEAIHLLGATKTGIIGSLGPVFTIGLAVVILGEDFGWNHFGGLFLVLIGVSFIRK